MIYVPGQAQSEMIDRLIELDRVALWAQMGLGKTSSVYTGMLYREPLAPTFPTLVVAPKRVARVTWPNEQKKWDHLHAIRVIPIIGSNAERIAAMKRPAEVYTINYDNLPWLRETLGNRWPFALVVSDESTRLKGFRLKQGGIRTRALAQVAHNLTSGLWEATGTPSPNGLKDLWGQLWYLDRGWRLGTSFKAFSDRWFYTNVETGNLVPKPGAQQNIEAAVSDIAFSFRSRDYMDVSEPMVFDREVDLPSKARKHYDDIESKLWLMIDQDVKVVAANASAKTHKLRQFCQGAVFTVDENGERSPDWHRVHDVKLDELESIRNEACGMPVLVAYEYTFDRERILAAFPDAEVFDDDPETEARWNRGEIPMLLIQYQSSSFGSNLQDGSNIIVLYGMTWNLEYYEQVIERVGPVRQKQSGHDRGTIVYRIIMRDSIESVMRNRIKTKSSVQNALMQARRNRRMKQCIAD